MSNRESKDVVLREIADLTGTPYFPTARGGTVTREFVDEMARLFGVSNDGNKTEVLMSCLAVVGLPWRPQFDSTRSLSGGGGTITQYGLIAIRNAVIDLMSHVEPHEDVDLAVDSSFAYGLGGYIQAPEIYNHEGDFAPGQIDPDALGDGFERHNRTQNMLANFLQAHGATVLSPQVHDPKFDLFWVGNQGAFVCEVKSITHENEESQLRKAVGQVLRYQAQLHALGRSCKAVVVTDTAFVDESWNLVFMNNEMFQGCGPDFAAIEQLI